MSGNDGIVVIKKGTDRELVLTLEDAEGNPVDVSTATQIKALFLPATGSTLLERTLTGGHITVLNGREKIKVTLANSFTSTMKVDEEQNFEVEATISSKIYVWCFKESLTVAERLTA